MCVCVCVRTRVSSGEGLLAKRAPQKARTHQMLSLSASCVAAPSVCQRPAPLPGQGEFEGTGAMEGGGEKRREAHRWRRGRSGGSACCGGPATTAQCRRRRRSAARPGRTDATDSVENRRSATFPCCLRVRGVEGEEARRRSSRGTFSTGTGTGLGVQVLGSKHEQGG